MQLIVVCGAPASGKSRLAPEIARAFKAPLLARDTIKETLFDALGYSTREWSSKLGAASYDVLFALLTTSMRSGSESIVIESNFTERASEAIQRLADEFGYDIVQVFCHASPECLWERYRSRAISGERHPGHVDAENLEEARERTMSQVQAPLPLSGKVVSVDTSDGAQVPLAEILKAIQL